MSKGFAKPPKKYPPNGRWFCSYNWENGFYGTLDECLDRIEHCFSDSKFRLSSLLVSNAIGNAKSDQTVSGELLSVLEKTEEEIRRQEQQHIAQVRAQVRDKCLRDGVSEGRQDLTPWDICFKGRGR